MALTLEELSNLQRFAPITRPNPQNQGEYFTFIEQGPPSISDIQAATRSSNPYASLMNLTPQQRMPPSYLTPPTATGSTGGFDPTIYKKLPGLLTQPAAGTGGGAVSGGGGGYDSGGANSAFDKLTNEEKAAYYSANPKMSSLTQALQKAFGFTSLGMLQKGLVPDFVREQQAIAQGTEAYSGYRNFGKESTIPSGGIVSPGVTATIAESIANAREARDIENAQAAQAQQAQAAAMANAAAQAAANEATGGGGGYGSGGGEGGSQPGGSGTGAGGYGPQAKGGLITPRDVKGPNPPGPDDGLSGLDIGEYVIRKSAVKKYGSNIFEKINAGQIPAKRLKSLLE